MKVRTLTGQIIDEPGPKPNVITIYNEHSIHEGEEQKHFCEGAEQYFKKGECFGCQDTNDARCFDLSTYSKELRTDSK